MLRCRGPAGTDGKTILLRQRMIRASNQWILPGGFDNPGFQVVQNYCGRYSAKPLKRLDMARQEAILMLAENDGTVCFARVPQTGRENPGFSHAAILFVIDEAKQPKIHIHAVARDIQAVNHRLLRGRAHLLDIAPQC